MVTESDRRKAIKIFKEAKGTVQMKIAFLMKKKGFSYVDCLDAMNEAGDNALLKSAGVY